MQIVELLTPEYEAAWLPWAVQYFFFIGIAATTALTAAVLAFGKSGSPSARLLPAAVVVLLVTAVAAPVSLLADLHQPRSEEHTSELQSRENLVCRLLLEKKKKT